VDDPRSTEPGGASASRGLERARELLEPEGRDAASPSGYLDLVGGHAPASTGAIQGFMLTGFVPRIYERWWRPALGRVAKGPLGPGMDGEHRIAQALLGLDPGDAALDVACGPGNFTRDFARTVGPDGLSVGIDVSETMLARAVRDTERTGLTAQTAYVRGDAQELPFVDGTFDGVCCFAALHLFADPLRALDRMAGVLAPGGRIAILTSARGRTQPRRALEALGGRRSGARMFERHEIAAELEARGFVDVRRRLTGVTQFVGGRKAG
jgi:SAM-dependent methyltransferase